MTAFAESPPDAAQVVKLLESKHSALVNLQFQYDVDSNMVDSSVRGLPKERDLALRRTKEEFSVLEPSSTEDSLNWVSWTVHSQKEGRTPISSFFVYDGERSYRFLRSVPEEPRVIPYNTGLIEAGYNNQFLAENYFERILYLKLNGSSQNLESVKKSKPSRDYQFAGETDYLGRKGWLFTWDWRPGKLRKESIVLTGPVCMVANHKTISIPEDRVLAEFRVEELAEVDGRPYPSKGCYVETDSKRKYCFRVTRATELDESRRESWVPGWPGGTHVRDFLRKTAFTVARTSDEVEELMKITPKKE